MLKRSIKYCDGREDTDDLYWSISSGMAQLWIMAIGGEIVASCVSELREYPLRKVLHAMFLGGDRMKEWLSVFVEKLKKFAEYNNADGIEFLGRPGWTKFLGEFGFCAKKTVFMEFKFDGRQGSN